MGCGSSARSAADGRRTSRACSSGRGCCAPCPAGRLDASLSAGSPANPVTQRRTTDDFRDIPVWRGLRPCSPDGLPYLGRFGRYANLTAATGHAMMGLSLGPITGKIVSEIISGEKPSPSIDLLNPDRYS